MNKVRLIALLLCVFAVFAIGSSTMGASAAPTESFTFTHNLTLGSRGDDVSALQQLLISDGYLKISIPTGYFGLLTRAALGAWQARSNISPPAGFFGPVSRGKMNAALERAAAAQQEAIDAIRVPVTVGTTTTVVTTTSPNVAAVSMDELLASPASLEREQGEPTGRPVRLRIPKLNIDAGIQYTGLKPDGTMEIPNNIFDVGWFTSSSRPGEQGSSIMTGHVAQIRGGVLTKPGVFSSLNELRPGDELSVQNDKGESIRFIVRESRLYDPAADATDVFASTDGRVHLNLITCEGIWNPSQLSYSQRLVVFADLW